MTLNETIELMQSMAIKMPRSQDKKYNIGLYIETKQYKMYRDQYNVDLAEKLHQNL
jgi:glycerophosphoryl diester phosphodiesterase